jgi:hypothetical protein
VLPRWGQRYVHRGGPTPDEWEVRRPRSLHRKGWRIIAHSGFAWRSPNGDLITYNVIVVDGSGVVLPWVPHGTHRVAAINYKGKRHFVHRLVAFNTFPLRANRGRDWGNAAGLPCDAGHEAHHRENRVNRRVPAWLNSRRENLVAWTKTRHVLWHAANRDVPQL